MKLPKPEVPSWLDRLLVALVLLAKFLIYLAN